MAACTVCNLCDHPGTLSDAKDVARVPCTVRKFKDDLFTLWRCTNCSSLHCAEDADLPRYYAEYPVKQNSLNAVARALYEKRLRKLNRLGLRRSDRLLDYGGGNGIFAQFLKERGYLEAFCYDPGVSEFADLKTLENPYDAVVSYDAIAHEDDSNKLLRTLSGLVRPNGLLEIGTTTADHLKLSEVKDPHLHMPYHRHIFSERALIGVFREQKFVPVEICRRRFDDSLIPMVNERFITTYIIKSGGYFDALFEPMQWPVVLTSPILMVSAFFGYFLSPRDEILISFRKSA
jgi:SAM-dependent methyltransferase